MKRCPNCGVETDENANFCSLCGVPLQDKGTDVQQAGMTGRIGKEEKILSEYQQLSGFQKRKIFWKISGLVLISGILITLLIDYVATGSITWSRYPATILLFLFINSTLNTFLHTKWLPLLLLSFLSLILLLTLFDIYTEEIEWRAGPGILLLLLAYSTISALVFLTKKAKQKGLNIIAYSLLAAGILCICTEGMISIYLNSKIALSWSLIAAVSVLMISMLLLYIHYRLRKATDLKRFFHI